MRQGRLYVIVGRGGMYRVQWRIVVRTEKTFERLALAAQARAFRGRDTGLVSYRAAYPFRRAAALGLFFTNGL